MLIQHRLANVLAKVVLFVWKIKGILLVTARSVYYMYFFHFNLHTKGELYVCYKYSKH